MSKILIKFLYDEFSYFFTLTLRINHQIREIYFTVYSLKNTLIAIICSCIVCLGLEKHSFTMINSVGEVMPSGIMQVNRKLSVHLPH